MTPTQADRIRHLVGRAIDGAIIAGCRRRAKVTQKHLAWDMGVSQATISRIEQGLQDAGDAALWASALKFGVQDLEELTSACRRQADVIAKNTMTHTHFWPPRAQGIEDPWAWVLAASGEEGLRGLVVFAVETHLTAVELAALGRALEQEAP